MFQPPLDPVDMLELYGRIRLDLEIDMRNNPASYPKGYGWKESFLTFNEGGRVQIIATENTKLLSGHYLQRFGFKFYKDGEE